MISKDDEKRMENWGRANRECFKVTRGATAVFCDSLKYTYGLPEDFVGKRSSEIRAVDVKDANSIDEAFRSDAIPMIHKHLLRMHYVSRLCPNVIERRLSLCFRSFETHKSLAVNRIMQIVRENQNRDALKNHGTM